VSAKILIAIDASDTSFKVVRYTSRLVRQTGDIKITLFTVLPGLSFPERFLDEAMKRKHQVKAKQYFDQESKRMHELFENAKTPLIEAGINPESITTKFVFVKAGIARDIIEEIKKGGYDTVILGRRGLSKIHEFFIGSVSQKLLQYAKDFTVWIVA
jgi:nucleotide-binding universal stress UspA family protein